MKNLFVIGVLSSCLFSCSLLQRRGGGPEEEVTAQSQDSGDSDGPLFTPTGQEVTASPSSAQNTASANETEVSRLNTKVAALETKLDVLSANLERVQAQRAQAEPAKPQPHLAAPVDENAEVRDEAPAEVSAAPAKPNRFPSQPKSIASEPSVKSGATSAAEKDFKAAMTLFQNGQNLDASSGFALMAKKFPHHMLAAHALYWAGEAASRAQQWQLAIENWSELEHRYPRSAYMPEAINGLAHAYEATGDTTKAKMYRTVLLRAFPKSPIAMKSGNAPSDTPVAREISHRSASAPIAANPAPAVMDDPAPSFEEEGGSDPGVAPTVPETVNQ